MRKVTPMKPKALKVAGRQTAPAGTPSFLASPPAPRVIPPSGSNTS
jgi:hypothetical protein